MGTIKKHWYFNLWRRCSGNERAIRAVTRSAIYNGLKSIWHL